MFASRAACIATVVLVVACGAPAPPATGPAGSGGARATLAPPPIDVTGVPSAVRVDIPKATASWIGPAGGTLRTTAADGTAYELELPEGAVPTRIAITMTPVTAIEGLALAGGLAGAVYLQPSGLRLAVPATLRITTNRTAPAGLRLAGFDVPGGDGSIDLAPAAGGGKTLAVTVFHFSAPGAGWGTTQDLLRLAPVPATGRLAGVLSRLLAFDVPWDTPSKTDAFAMLLALWDVALKPELTAVASDTELIRVLADWRQFVFLLNLFARSGDAAAAVADGLDIGGAFPLLLNPGPLFEEGRTLIGKRIVDALAGNKAICTQSHDFGALANLSFWAAQGQRHATSQRDWAQEGRGCAEVVVAIANLPTTLTNGGSDTIGLQLALKFSDGTQRPADVDITLTGNGITFQGGATTTSASVAAGFSTSASVTATRQPPYAVTVAGCWVHDGLPRTLCSTIQLPFGANPTASAGSAPAGSGGPVPNISGKWSISASCNSVAYGTGTGTVTQQGASMTLTWSVVLQPNPDQASRDSGCWGAFTRGELPSGGTLTGTIAVGSNSADLVISSITANPCRPTRSPLPSIPMGAGRIRIPINHCAGAGPAQYLASFVGP